MEQFILHSLSTKDQFLIQCDRHRTVSAQLGQLLWLTHGHRLLHTVHTDPIKIFQNLHGLRRGKCAIRIGSYLQVGLQSARLDQEIASSFPIVLSDLELDATESC